MDDKFFNWLSDSFKQKNLDQSILNSSGDQSISNLDSLSVGGGSTGMYVDQNGLSLGGYPGSSPPFSVDMDGNINASSLVISGSQISNGSITSTQIASGTITGSNIAGGTITASNIASNTITANKLSVSTLSAITANLGSITAGSITGISFQTASSGNRVVMTSGSDQLQFYNSNGITGVIANYGGDGNLGLIAGSNLYLSADGGGIYVHIDGSGDIITSGYFSTSNGIYLNGHFLKNGTSSGQINIDGSNKTAIVSTSSGYKSLYCIESPEIWFMDFCDLMKNIDPVFLEVTEGEMHFIKTEDGYQVWRRRRGHANKRFETNTYEEFLANEKFLQMAKA